MHLRFTLVLPQAVDHGPDPSGAPGGSGPTRELAVDVPDGAGAADLVRLLTDVLGSAGLEPARFSLLVDGQALPDDARLGMPPLLDGAVLSCRAPTALDPPPARAGGQGRTSNPVPPPEAALHLHVTSGPDAGRRHPLTPGRYRLGRAAEASLRIEDPDLSRVHLLVDVGAGGVHVRDLHSSNGSRLEGVRLTDRRTAWGLGARLRVGTSVLELAVHGSPSAATSLDGQGHVLVNRRPRLDRPAVNPVIHLPAPPSRHSAARLSVLAIALPLAVAAPIAWLQHSPAYLMFGLMSPVMLLGNHIADRRGGRRTERRSRQVWSAQLAAARREVAAARATEGGRRRAAMPDAAAMAQLVRQPGAAIWERRPGDGDFLTLRIGLGALPSDVRVVEPQPPGDGADEGEQLLPDVPVGVGLGDVGVLGVAGPRAGTLGLARSLVAQVAGLHSPQEVTLVVLSAQDDDAAWAWTSLLPHARPDPREGHWRMGSLARPEQMRKRLGALEAELDARLDVQRRGGRAGGGGRTDGGGRAVTERIVLVVDGAARLRASPEVARLLVDGPAVGIHAICLDSATSRLPAECGAVIELGDGVGATLTGRAGYVPDVVPDLVSEAWAERFARTIAPLRDATPAAGDAALPVAARLLDLLGDGATEPEVMAETWRTSTAGPRAVIGASADGPYVVDLRRDGPHVLFGRHHRCGQVRAAADPDRSLAVAQPAGRPVLRAGGLQGRRGLPALRRAAARASAW